MLNCLIDQESKLFQVNNLQTKIPNICLSPDGTFGLIYYQRQHYISRICLKSGKETNFPGNPGEGGFRNGPQEQTLFNKPSSLIFSPNGKFALVIDTWNSCIRMICVATGNVSTFATLPRTKHQNYNNPIFSPDGKFVFVCCIELHCIIKICVKTRKISNFAGVHGVKGSRNGPKEQALLYRPQGLTFSTDETYLLVCDTFNFCIRKICLLSGQVSTFAGIPGDFISRNGPKEQAKFQDPKSLAFSPDGTYILVCDTYCIRKICLQSGNVSTFSGIPNIKGSRNGIKEQATFRVIKEITFSKNGKFIFIQDSNNCRYMKIKK